MAVGEDWTWPRVRAALERGNICSFYFLFGDESYLIDRAYRGIVDAAIPMEARDFNYTALEVGRELGSAVSDAIETLPVMAPRRVVVLRGVDDLTVESWEELLDLVERYSDQLVVICLGSKVDRRKKFYKRAQALGIIIEFRTLYENQVDEWLAETARREFGLDLSALSASLLREYVGLSLGDLASELEKLSLALMSDGPAGRVVSVDPDTITQYVPRTRQRSVFEFTDAVGRGDGVRGLLCLVQLLDQGQSPIGIVALLARHFRILRAISSGKEEGVSGTRLAARAGVSPYFLKDYTSQAGLWSKSDLSRVTALLIEADRALKTTSLKAHVWLENFVLQVCSLRQSHVRLEA